MWVTKCILLIPERFLKINLYDMLTRYNSIKEWCYIYHSDDDGYPIVGPHFHVYLDFKNSKINSEWIAKWFKIPEYCVLECPFDKETVYTLFTHLFDFQKDLRQYGLKNLIIGKKE